MDIKELESLLSRYEAGESELFDTLEKEYAKLVEDNPGNVKYIHNYGYLYECRGRENLKKAEKIYEKALFKQNNLEYPDNFRIDAQLMQVRNALGKNKASIELYKKRVLEYPDQVSEYMYLAKAYLYADQVQEAKKVMEAAEKVDPGLKRSRKIPYLRSGFCETMGEICSRLGENEKALDYWSRSVEDQYSMGGWYSRAFLLKELGRLDEAAQEWRKIIKTLEEYHDPSLAIWPKDELAKIEAQLNME